MYVVDDLNSIRDLVLNANYLEFRNSNISGYESMNSYYIDKRLDIFKKLIKQKNGNQF